jgi:hypothetical protein
VSRKCIESLGKSDVGQRDTIGRMERQTLVRRRTCSGFHSRSKSSAGSLFELFQLSELFLLSAEDRCKGC